MDMATIGGALASINAARDLAKTMIGLRDTELLQAKTIELNGFILQALEKAIEARHAETAQAEEISKLKARIVQLETWEAEKQRYELDKLPPGVFVYSLRAGMEEGEPPHQICERCYNQGKKSILHQDEESNGLYHLNCNGCGTTLMVGRWIQPPSVQLRYDPFEGM